MDSVILDKPVNLEVCRGREDIELSREDDGRLN